VVSEGVFSWRCFEGEAPNCPNIRGSFCGGEGVARDSGLLLWMDDAELEGVM